MTRQRHLTPSCGGLDPYRGENPGPGKDAHEELDPMPGIREQPRSSADISAYASHVRFTPQQRTQRTALQQKSDLFDHLVGEQQKVASYRQSERFSGF